MGVSSQAGQFALAKQTGRGVLNTTIDTTGVAVRRKGGSLTGNRELMVPDAEIGGDRDVPDALLGPVSFSGDIEFYTRFSSIGTFLQAALGPAVTSGAALTGYKHKFVPSDASQLPFYSIYERFGADMERAQYTDCVVNTLSLEVEPGGYLQGSVSVIGCRQLLGVPDLDLDDIMDETTLTVGTNVRVLYDGADIKAKSFSLQINNNFEDDDFRLGSFFLEDLTPKRREVSGTLKLRHENSQMMRQALLGSSTATQAGGLTTKKPIEVQIDTYMEIPGTTPPVKFGLNLKFDQTVFEPFGLEPEGDSILENDVNFRALRPSRATPVMEAELTNGEALVA